jgi:hypothetical protein
MLVGFPYAIDENTSTESLGSFSDAGCLIFLPLTYRRCEIDVLGDVTRVYCDDTRCAFRSVRAPETLSEKQNRLRSLPEQVDCTRRLRAMIEASASVWIGLNIRLTGAAEVAKGGRSARRGAKTACYGCPGASALLCRSPLAAAEVLIDPR